MKVPASIFLAGTFHLYYCFTGDMTFTIHTVSGK